MVKLVLLFVGLIGGASGAVSWLLGAPAPPDSAVSGASPVPEPHNLVTATVDELKARAVQALAAGQQAGTETENRLRAQFDSYRRAARRTGSGS